MTAARDLIAASSIAPVEVRMAKLIIAGSRNVVVSTSQISDAVDRMLEMHDLIPVEVVSGCARGVDRCGEEYATEVGLRIKRFPAQWSTHGRSAGPMRNLEMARYGDALLAFWDGSSHGTRDMIDAMRGRGKPVLVVKP